MKMKSVATCEQKIICVTLSYNSDLNRPQDKKHAVFKFILFYMLQDNRYSNERYQILVITLHYILSRSSLFLNLPMLIRNIGYKDTVRVMQTCFLLTINVYFQSVMKTQNHIKFKNDLRCEKQTLRGLSIAFINQYWPWTRF